MKIADRAAALWATSQWLIILALVAALSIALNLWQLKRAITAPLRAEVKMHEDAARKAEQLLSDGQERERRWLDAGDQVAGTLQRAGKDYKWAVAQRPLAPQCAPGAERVQAVNATLGNTPP